MVPSRPSAPAWFERRMRSYMGRVDAFDPYPFELPDQHGEHVALHLNDYLRLSARPEVIAAKCETLKVSGNGNMASVIYGGACSENNALRARLSEVMAGGDAFLTVAGYTAILGLIESIVEPGMPVYLDDRAHASRWDGAKFSAGRPIGFAHNDPSALAEEMAANGPGLVCIATVYSVHGDVAPLREILEITEANDSLLLADEAHAFGMFGPAGGGLAVAEQVADRVHFRTGSFSKALGGHAGCGGGPPRRARARGPRERPRGALPADGRAPARGARPAADLHAAVQLADHPDRVRARGGSEQVLRRDARPRRAGLDLRRARRRRRHGRRAAVLPRRSDAGDGGEGRGCRSPEPRRDRSSVVTTIVDLLRDRAASRPEVEAYRFLRDGEGSPETRSWADLDRRARAIGATLRERGAAGTNVLMLYPPGIDFIDGYFGCLYAGAVPVPAYPPEPARLQRTLPRVQAIVADAGAKFALSTKSLLALAEMVFAFAPDLRALSWLATDTLDRAAADAWSRPDITHEALAMLQYASGSTGTPKGVMLSHANMLANAASVVSAFEVTPEDRWFSWLPVFHDMGFMQGVLQPLYSGCPVTAISPTAFLVRPFRWLAVISIARATLSGSPGGGGGRGGRGAAPGRRGARGRACWKLAFNGAETVRLDTIERFAEMIAPAKLRRSAMFPCYGLAEATLIVSGNGRDAEPIAQAFSRSALEEGRVEARADGQVLVASGGIVAGAAVAIVDPEQRVRTAADRIGEIWVAGGSVGRGYWNRPDDTAATFGLALPDDPRRYMRTGDLGFLRDGQLYVCGRVKDVIIVRGANHYPQDIELTGERASAAIRPGCVAAVAFTVDGEERVAVVAEIDRRFEKARRGAARPAADRRSGEPSPRLPDPAAPPRPDTEPLDVDRLFWEIREAIGAAHELDPYAVVLIRAGSIHKTSSGKLQRQACRAAYDKDEHENHTKRQSDGTKRHSDVASKPRTRSPSSAPVAPAGAPVADAAQIDLAALRRPAVIVVARSVEIAESLSR